MNYRNLILLFISLLHINAFGNDIILKKSNLLGVNPKFRHITVDDGLMQNKIKDICQDADGQIWLGSDMGITKLVGKQIINSSATIENPNGFRDNSIEDIYLDWNGDIWLAAHNTNLTRYSKKGDVYKHFILKDNTYGINTIFSVSNLDSGKIVFGTNNGLFMCQIETRELTPLYTRNDFLGVYSLTWDRNKTRLYFIGTTSADNMDHLFYYSITDNKAYQLPDVSSAETLKQNWCITKIHMDLSDRIWLCSTGGVYILDPQNQSYNQIKLQSSNSSINANDVVEDIFGRYFISTNNGLLVLNHELTTYQLIEHDEDNEYSLNSNQISNLLFDRDGTLWVGTKNGGVNITNLNSPLNKIQLFKSTSTNTQFKGDGISAIVSNPDNVIYLGSANMGLILFDPAKNKFEYLHSNKVTNAPGGYEVLDLSMSTAGEVWAVNGTATIDKYEPNQNTIRQYTFSQLGIEAERALSIICMNDSIAWLGTNNGLYKVNYDNKSSRLVKTNIPQSENVARNIYLLSKESDSVMWVASNIGLMRMNMYTSKVLKYIPYSSNNDFKAQHVSNIYTDSRGRVWISTLNIGLYLYDQNTDAIRHISFGEKTNLLKPKSILEDNNGDLWIATNNGLYVTTPSGDSFENLTLINTRLYTKDDGLQGNAYNAKAACKLNDGRLVVAGPNGFNIINPEEINGFQLHTPLIFTGYSINGLEQLSLITGGKRKPTHINYTELVNILPSQHLFILSFTTLNQINPEKTQYAYKLEGLHDDWIYLGQQNQIFLSHLSAGDYLLKIRATDANGQWGQIERQLAIKVVPDWYATTGFQIAALLVIIFSIFLWFRQKTFALRMQKIKMQELVDIQTNELRSSNEKLKVQQEEILNQNEEISIQNQQILAQHDELEGLYYDLQAAQESTVQAKDQLQKVNERLEVVIEERTRELNDILNKLLRTNVELDSFIFNSSLSMRGPAAQLMGLCKLAKLESNDPKSLEYFNKIEDSVKHLDALLFKFSQIHEVLDNELRKKPITEEQVEQIINKVRKQVYELNDEFETAIHFNDFEVKSDLELLEVIIFNLLENSKIFAVKKQPVKVSLYVRTDGEKLLITCIDNGIGMSDLVKDRAYDMFFRGSELSKGNGLGLFLVKRIIDMMKGQINLSSKPGQGTIVNISVPLQD